LSIAVDFDQSSIAWLC